jgi:hypothetical protein
MGNMMVLSNEVSVLAKGSDQSSENYAGMGCHATLAPPDDFGQAVG